MSSEYLANIEHRLRATQDCSTRGSRNGNASGLDCAASAARGTLRNTLRFALHSPICSQLDLRVCRAAACCAAGCKACGEFDDGVRCLPRPPAAAVPRSGMLWPSLACRGRCCRGTALAADPSRRAHMREPVTVHLDQATLLKLPERTATIVVGNPLIADVAVQPGGLVVGHRQGLRLDQSHRARSHRHGADGASDPGGRPGRRRRRGLSRHRARDL